MVKGISKKLGLAPVRRPVRGGQGRDCAPNASAAARGRRPFTLVEMLIVVAIIAILAALLMPSLQKTLSKARDLGCLNNPRQIVVAAQAYTGDNHGRMPPGILWKDPYLRWQDYMAPYCGINVSSIYSRCFIEKHYVGTVLVQRGQGILACPAMSDAAILAVDAANGNPNGGRCTQNFKFDYGLNEHLSGFRVPKVRQAGRTFFFMDMRSDNGTGVQGATSGHLYSWGGCANAPHVPDNKAPNSAWPMYAWALPRHGDKQTINIAYVDGHVAPQFMPVFGDKNYVGGGDVPNGCSQPNFKAGIWFERK